MAKSVVNLDALIIREDFEVRDEVSRTRQMSGDLKLNDFNVDSIPYQMLRKPDFQRETSRWTPDKILDLIKSFLDGDLIPSLILWRSETTGNIFVIDGAHRLSALIAWVNDDYGDKEISQRFYDNAVPEEQVKAAVETRRIIEAEIGSYQELLRVGRNPSSFPQVKVRRAQNASVFKIDLQWVAGGAANAEQSFFKINQQATPIDQTELLIIKSRKKPNAIAARALLHAGVGHKYWSGFPDERQKEIEEIASDIYETLFTPPLGSPIKTLDLPIAGKGYSHESVELVFDFVNFANGLRTPKSREPDRLPDDIHGDDTLRYLQRVRSLAYLVTGNHPGSLGLHPAIYFYGATGKYQASSFLATIDFIQNLHTRNHLNLFTLHRAKFEQFLLRHKEFPNQIVRHLGGKSRSLDALLQLYLIVFTSVAGGLNDSQIIEKLKAERQLKFLQPITDDDREHGRNFSRETKNNVFLREALKAGLKCQICDGLIHTKAISFDHIERLEDGGGGSPLNAQMSHPYCNTGYKEYMEHQRRQAENTSR